MKPLVEIRHQKGLLCKDFQYKASGIKMGDSEAIRALAAHTYNPKGLGDVGRDMFDIGFRREDLPDLFQATLPGGFFAYTFRLGAITVYDSHILFWFQRMAGSSRPEKEMYCVMTSLSRSSGCFTVRNRNKTAKDITIEWTFGHVDRICEYIYQR